MTADHHHQAASLLLHARQSGQLLETLPPTLIPQTVADQIAIQNLLATRLGQIGGWKVGASTPDSIPSAGPMPQAWMRSSGSTIATHRFRGLECEVAFLLGRDLPPRPEPYSDEEVYDAVASCHPAIEILESALATPRDPALKSIQQADLMFHGGFVFGPAYPNWRSVDFQHETVTLTIDGVERIRRTGSNTSGNLLRLLPWLANAGAARTGGLRAGQWVTTGSWTGVEQASPGSNVEATFTHLGSVGLHFT